MIEAKKGTCINCLEENRVLDSQDRCIFCTCPYHGPGTEIKDEKFDRKGGTEIKSKTSDYRKENAWMA